MNESVPPSLRTRAIHCPERSILIKDLEKDFVWEGIYSRKRKIFGIFLTKGCLRCQEQVLTESSIGLTRMTPDHYALSTPDAFLFRETVRGQTETRRSLHGCSPSLNAEVVRLGVA
jgi:hypothetical protein